MASPESSAGPLLTSLSIFFFSSLLEITAPLCDCIWKWPKKLWLKAKVWTRKWQSTLVVLPGESHGKRSLVGYGSWGHKESDTTEWLSTPQRPGLSGCVRICCYFFLTEFCGWAFIVLWHYLGIWIWWLCQFSNMMRGLSNSVLEFSSLISVFIQSSLL